MKRVVLLSLFTFLIFTLGIKQVSALETTLFAKDIKYLATCSNTDYSTCGSLLGDPNCEGHFAYYLQMGLDIIKYVGIIACIVLTVVDFAKALFGDDKDMLKPLSKKAFSRLIYAVMLFLLPYIVNFILTLIDVYGTCGIK